MELPARTGGAFGYACSRRSRTTMANLARTKLVTRGDETARSTAAPDARFSWRHPRRNEKATSVSTQTPDASFI